MTKNVNKQSCHHCTNGVSQSGRPILAARNNQRITVTGVFERYGVKTGYVGNKITTVKLMDVRCVQTGIQLADHNWFTCGKRWKDLGPLTKGDVICLTGRVKPYVKGYKGRRKNVYKPISTSHKIANPTNIYKVPNIQSEVA